MKLSYGGQCGRNGFMAYVGSGDRPVLNRLIRRWFPKGTDFSKVTAAQIAALQDWINNYPRKILNWSISNTVFGKFTIAAQPFHFSMGFAVSPVFLQLRKGERQSGYSCICFVKYLQFTDTVPLHIAAALRNSFVW